MSVSLTSNGNTAATIRSVSISPNFTIVSNYCNTNLTPGSTCMMTIAFTPLASTAPGNVSGTLTIVDTAPGSPRIVHLSGAAVATGQQLALSQTSVAFNSQPVQTSSPAQVVYLVDLGPPNTSAPRVQINRIVLGGANPADLTMTENCGGTLGFTIGGRQSCMISVAFSPAAKSTGSRSANVTITPASNSPLVIQLSGTVKELASF